MNGEIIKDECSDHLPEWEVVKSVEFKKGIFGRKRNWRKFCCGLPMLQCVIIEMFQCKKCGRAGHKKEERMVQCSVCGSRSVRIPLLC